MRTIFDAAGFSKETPIRELSPDDDQFVAVFRVGSDSVEKEPFTAVFYQYQLLKIYSMLMLFEI